MERQQFTIRGLMLGTAIIALGIAGPIAAFRVNEHQNGLVTIIAFIGTPLSGPLIGAGLFLPLGKAGFGAVLGLLLMLLVACVLPIIHSLR